MNMEKSKMKRYNKAICSIMPLVLTFLVQGCSTVRDPEDAGVHPELNKLMQDDSVARRFQDSVSKNPTAIESAIELSEKYARLSEETASLRQQNQSLMAQNQQAREQVNNIEKQLQQTQKELNEANDLLIEMRVELNNWKSDVLGFRTEMRNAETAQLEALLKILRVLGGELKTETAQSSTVGSAVASLNP
jgi:chromosome segregation ATPase